VRDARILAQLGRIKSEVEYTTFKIKQLTVGGVVVLVVPVVVILVVGVVVTC
jgi:hypothetical protein